MDNCSSLPVDLQLIHRLIDAHVIASPVRYVQHPSLSRWNTSDIGIIFDRPSNFAAQLEKTANGGGPRLAERREAAVTKYFKDRIALEPSMSTAPLEEAYRKVNWVDDLTPDERFAKLKSFYTPLLMLNSTPSDPIDLSTAYGYASPGALSRIMGIYSGVTGYGGKRRKEKTEPVREATSLGEGLKLLEREEDIIEKMKKAQWDGSDDQLVPTCAAKDPRSVLVRCPAGTNAFTNETFKALQNINYVPTMVLRLLHPTPTDYNSLPPLKPIQFLLTLRNPLFDPIRITLATPSHTPGRFSSRVTILCPEFEIGANTDVWDEALSAGGKEKRRTKAESSEGQAEAGKIWEKGRNWTTVVLEVVPASIDPPPQFPDRPGQPTPADTPLEEDDDVLEIPLFVRAEYETDAVADAGDATGVAGAEKEKERRELAYWCVLGVGRIAHSGLL
ncbi:MAG: hypothetical protein M1839_000816 [Geoglossum umbratile]|nr:MAG: hypothetical protein M1839_000816 [Geoglossum umbratile]